jgi:hypothetical protein
LPQGAARRGIVVEVERIITTTLVEHGVGVDAPDDIGQTALMFAAIEVQRVRSRLGGSTCFGYASRCVAS